MEFPGLLEALSRPDAYPTSASDVEVHQTHISAVFLVGPWAYKVKKPVRLGFVDFSTVDRRRHFCDEEVRLNRRLAPSVYLGVVPVVRHQGRLQVEGDGEVVDWAVKMRRLPAEANWQERLKRGDLQTAALQRLALRLVEFHAAAASGPEIAAGGRLEIVARNARENFEQTIDHVGSTVSPVVHERLRQLTETALRRLGPLIERRVEQGRIRDTHGDLRLEHIYEFPDRGPPEDLLIIDCVEFNEWFRWADPVADIAFLVMDFAARGRRDLGDTFADAYFAAADDAEGRELLAFYVAYRAAVRAKVAGFKWSEPEVPTEERSEALARAQARWLLALSVLDEPGRGPCLLAVGGLPGSGKSTLARALAERTGAVVIRSDSVRKELAGLPEGASAAAGFAQGIYDADWTERTYAECCRRAAAELFQGSRVIIDASFARQKWRQRLQELGIRWGVPTLLLLCQAEPEVVRSRLADRRRDASDADWSVYQEMARRWEPLGGEVRAAVRPIRTDGSIDDTVDQAWRVLKEARLVA
ncbi:MAG: AAA family ATPase [Gemmataceae bacterium]|nr:AAA family ATPase [Gemmataceae bacterium]MDW8266133.1 AAA family ATPase [Gemmataceae bacterium]